MAMNYDDPVPVSELEGALDDSGLDQQSVADLLESAGVGLGTTTVNVASVTINADGSYTVQQQEGVTPDFVVIDASAVGGQATYTPPAGFENVPAVVFDSRGDITWTISSVATGSSGVSSPAAAGFPGVAAAEVDGAFDRSIVSGAGNDAISVQTGENVYLDGRDGNDVLTTSGGNDSVAGGDGNDSISAGAGNDSISGGAGNDSIYGSAGDDSIDAGTGYDYMELDVNRGDLQYVNGQLVSSSTGTTIQNVQYLEFADGATLTVTDDPVVAATMRLYDTVLGRSAELGGAEWWSENADSYFDTLHLAEAFLASDEFALLHPGGLSDGDFVNLMYQNTFDRAPDAAGYDYWVEQLEQGVSRAYVAIYFADSTEAQLDTTDVMQIDDDNWV